MRFEYFLLLLLSVLPLLYKVYFWGSVFEGEKYSVRNFFMSFTDAKKREKYHHFWNYIEIPLLLFSLSIFYYAPLEVFVFSFSFYTLGLYNIFMLGKIFRKRCEYFKNIYLFSAIVMSVAFTLFLALSFGERFIYIWILFPLVLIPIYYIVFIGLYNLIQKKWKK